MEAKYIKEHNNYSLTLSKSYRAKFYKEGWLLIENDDEGNRALYREECFEREEYCTEEASIHALRFCEKYPGWKRICDIEDSDNLYKTWNELSERAKRPWIREYRDRAEDAWGEWGNKPCKVQYGFISGKGKFYKKVTDVPHLHNLIMIFKVG